MLAPLVPELAVDDGTRDGEQLRALLGDRCVEAASARGTGNIALTLAVPGVPPGGVGHELAVRIARELGADRGHVRFALSTQSTDGRGTTFTTSWATLDVPDGRLFSTAVVVPRLEAEPLRLLLFVTPRLEPAERPAF